VQKNIEIMITTISVVWINDPRLAEWQVLEQIIKPRRLPGAKPRDCRPIVVQLNPDGTLQGAKRMKNSAT
jgi:replicative DNA helicase